MTFEEFRTIVADVLRESLGVEQIDPDAGLGDLGLDSLGLTEFLTDLEDALNMPDGFPDGQPGIDRDGTLNSLMHALYGVLPSSTPVQR